MKNHRFLWLRNRTTDNRKCEKARNIKEKRTIEMFSTVSKPQDVLLSFQRDNKKTYNRITETLGNAMFSRVFCTVNWKSGSSLYETETINK